MRLGRHEQIIIQNAAHENPGVLAEWLLDWVKAQQRVGTGGSFDIGTIPLRVGYPPMGNSTPPVDLDFLKPAPEPKSRVDVREEWKKILADVGYLKLPVHQRKAINKFRQAQIKVVEETDRLPDTEVCWLGDHEMEGWEAEDFYLWVVAGEWASEKKIRKWGCKDCALLIARTHPGATVNAID